MDGRQLVLGQIKEASRSPPKGGGQGHVHHKPGGGDRRMLKALGSGNLGGSYKRQ